MIAFVARHAHQPLNVLLAMTVRDFHALHAATLSLVQDEVEAMHL